MGAGQHGIEPADQTMGVTQLAATRNQSGAGSNAERRPCGGLRFVGCKEPLAVVRRAGQRGEAQLMKAEALRSPARESVALARLVLEAMAAIE